MGGLHLNQMPSCFSIELTIKMELNAPMMITHREVRILIWYND